MIKYNFIRVITFISILVLFFAQSVYDPSVHAKMQMMEDESLSDVSGAALDIDMNLTVRSIVTDLFRLKDAQSPYDSINIGSMEICNGTAGTGFRINATMSWDIGALVSTGQTWLVGTNILFPYNNQGLGIIASNLYFGDNAASLAALGNYLPMGNKMIVKGISFGQDVTGTPTLDASFVSPFTSPWVIISSEGTSNRGLEFYSEIAGFVDNITYYWNNNVNDAGSLRVSGVYIYGLMNDVAGGNPATWTTRTGATKMGGSYPTYNVTTGAATGSVSDIYESIDIGTATAAGGNVSSRVTLNLPTAGSVRIKEFWFGSNNWGPIAVDDLVFYTNRVTFKDLNKL